MFSGRLTASAASTSGMWSVRKGARSRRLAAGQPRQLADGRQETAVVAAHLLAQVVEGQALADGEQLRRNAHQDQGAVQAEHGGGLLADDGHVGAVEGEVQAPSAGGRVSPWRKRGLRRWSLRAVARSSRNPTSLGTVCVATRMAAS